MQTAAKRQCRPVATTAAESDAWATVKHDLVDNKYTIAALADVMIGYLKEVVLVEMHNAERNASDVIEYDFFTKHSRLVYELEPTEQAVFSNDRSGNRLLARLSRVSGERPNKTQPVLYRYLCSVKSKTDEEKEQWQVVPWPTTMVDNEGFWQREYERYLLHDESHKQDLKAKLTRLLAPKTFFRPFEADRVTVLPLRNKLLFLLIGAEVTWELDTDHWQWCHRHQVDINMDLEGFDIDPLSEGAGVYEEEAGVSASVVAGTDGENIAAVWMRTHFDHHKDVSLWSEHDGQSLGSLNRRAKHHRGDDVEHIIVVSRHRILLFIHTYEPEEDTVMMQCDYNEKKKRWKYRVCCSFPANYELIHLDNRTCVTPSALFAWLNHPVSGNVQIWQYQFELDVWTEV